MNPQGTKLRADVSNDAGELVGCEVQEMRNAGVAQSLATAVPKESSLSWTLGFFPDSMRLPSRSILDSPDRGISAIRTLRTHPPWLPPPRALQESVYCTGSRTRSKLWRRALRRLS